MTDHAREISPAQALARIIHANHGSIPEHERPRALELACRIDDDARMMDKMSDRYEYPGLMGHKS